MLRATRASRQPRPTPRLSAAPFPAPVPAGNRTRRNDEQPATLLHIYVPAEAYAEAHVIINLFSFFVFLAGTLSSDMR